MAEFVDPRSNPESPPGVPRELAAHGEDLRELIQLCLAGRVYDVERWIQEGRPIQAPRRKAGFCNLPWAPRSSDLRRRCVARTLRL
jgi:hypothetical protein